MKLRKLMVILILIIFLFSIASVTAANTTDVMTSNDELSQKNEIISKKNEEIIKDGTTGTFAELRSNIEKTEAGSTLKLDKNYTCEEGFDTEGITIDKSITIDGQGHTIDAQGKARIFMVGAGNVVLKNIIFKNGKTTVHGGAIYFNKLSTGNVLNCSFTNNKVTVLPGYGSGGGAIWMSYGTVLNCNFTDNNVIGNSAWGGAIFIDYFGTVSNCNFINNTASDGGAVFFACDGNVTNCNFTGNIASFGSAIFFENYGSNRRVSNSSFLNNRANSVSLEVIKNDNNITITFKGENNLLNAIYSSEDVSFSNVTYWGANGIANTDSSTPVRSNNEAGQNITVKGVVNGNILNAIYTTDKDGKIVLEDVFGDYLIVVCHDTDSYYTEVETISTNMKFYVNVTPISTNNKTVNITAKSNVPHDILEGKLLFILPNYTKIIANYGGNGTWWVVHTFEKCMKYEVSAYYEGLTNVTVNNATITINKLQTELSADAIITTYNIGKDLVITLKDFNGNPVSNATVTVDLNGAKTYTTDKNGQVKVSTAGLIPKIYTAKITFAGDNNYNGSSIDVGVTVNKATPILKAKKKTYKAKTKTKKFKITLKDNTGKPLKNAKVRLMVKKITKNNKKGGSDKESKADKKKNFAVTNNKGKATFKGLRNKKGKYNAKVKFYSNEYYNKVTKTVKIVIK